MRRVLITGVSQPLGRRLVVRLAARPDVEALIGVDVQDGVVVREGALADGGKPSSPGQRQTLSDLVDVNAIDTVVHAALCPSRSGMAGQHTADVIATLQLAAATSDRGVRVVVAVSSTEAYTPTSAAPLWRREDELLRPRAESDAALIVEGEDYVRDVAERHPHISVAVLRLADLAGPDIGGPLASLLRHSVVPFVAGYDPAVQLLHIDDAVAAVEHTIGGELAGTFNVAGAGAVPWRTLACRAGRPAVPAPVVAGSLATALAALRVPHVPAALANLLRFGRGVDTTAFEATGFHPRHPTEVCARAAVS